MVRGVEPILRSVCIPALMTTTDVISALRSRALVGVKAEAKAESKESKEEAPHLVSLKDSAASSLDRQVLLEGHCIRDDSLILGLRL